jgi:hypothetical protein
VKISLDEIKTSDKYKKTDVNQIEFESVTISNDSILKFKNNSGRLDLKNNLISGVLKADDTTLISLDSVKYLNYRKFDYIKTLIYLSIIPAFYILVMLTADVP